MNQVLAEHGIQNLGGVADGFNLEIEYYDLQGEYHEAVFGVRGADTLEVIYHPSRHEVVLWMNPDGDKFEPVRIRFPEGINGFIDFRLPAAIGGQSVMDRIVEGSPNES